MHRRLYLILLAILLIAGCVRPLTVARMPATGPSVAFSPADTLIQGRVDFEERQSQAIDIETDIAPGATVSLIDSQTHQTVGATITTAEGEFVMSFGATFTPDASKVYYLEAVKGIKGINQQYNQVGAEAVRLRTLLFYRKGWVSLTNSLPGNVAISPGSTALSAMLGLKVLAGQAVDTERLIGCLQADKAAVWDEPGFPFPKADYEAVRQLIGNALDYDQDPMRYLTYSPDTGEFRKTGTTFTFSGMSATSGRVGDPITLAGSGFNAADPGKNLIRFNGAPVPAADIYVYENATKIDIHVPPGATTGTVSLEIGGTLISGDVFTVIGGDGHDALDDQGRLLVVNREFNTLSRITMDGTVTTLVDSGLNAPRSLTYDRLAKKLYVACYGNDTIVQFDMSTGDPTGATTWANVPHPSGLAIGADGYLYVSSFDEGQVSRFKLSDKSPGTSFTGFEQPVGLAFDFNGAHLFVAEQGNANAITRLKVSDGSKLTWAVVNTPWGLAVDSGGNVFAAANKGNALLKVAPPTMGNPTPVVTTVAAIPTPMGLDMDPTGTLYVSDGNGARLLRVTPSGAIYPFAYGVSTSYGLALDGDNNRYVALSTANAILKVSPDGKVSRTFAVGIANPYGLTYRNGHLFASHPETGGITRFDLQGRATSYGRGLRYGNTGIDVDPAGVVWANKYATLSTWRSNPERGDDQDGAWRYFPGLLSIPEGGVRSDVRALHNAPFSIAARARDVYMISYQGQLVRMSPTGVSNAYQFQVIDTLNKPRFVSFDRNGQVLVADNGTGTVYRYDPANGFARSTLGGVLTGVYAVAADPTTNTIYATTYPGNKLYKLDGALWTALTTTATFNFPSGVVVQPDGILVVADRDNSRVKTVNPVDGTWRTLAAPPSRPYHVDLLRDGRIVVATDSGGNSGIIVYDASGDSYTQLRAAGSISLFAMGIDRNDGTVDNIYNTSAMADLRRTFTTITGSTTISSAVYLFGAPYNVPGEVLVHASGRYLPSTTGFYKYGEGGQPDLNVNLGFPALGFASVGGTVYFSSANSGNTLIRELYRITNAATGAWEKVTTATLPDNALAIDSDKDGVLEFIGQSDAKLYRFNGPLNTQASQVPAGLRKPDF